MNATHVQAHEQRGLILVGFECHDRYQRFFILATFSLILNNSSIP